VQYGWRRRLTVATLLLAAVATHADLPRLNLALNLGDTLNAIRVMDPVQHIRMQLRLDTLAAHERGQLETDLQDGRESLELLADTASIHGVLPRLFRARAPLTLSDNGFTPGEAAEPLPLHGLVGTLLALDLPPPRLEALWQPPAFEAPGGFTPRLMARAPPLR
jgi:hypothetical protein